MHSVFHLVMFAVVAALGGLFAYGFYLKKKSATVVEPEVVTEVKSVETAAATDVAKVEAKL